MLAEERANGRPTAGRAGATRYVSQQETQLQDDDLRRQIKLHMKLLCFRKKVLGYLILI